MKFEDCFDLMIEKFKCKPEVNDNSSYICRNFSHESGLKVGYYVEIRHLNLLEPSNYLLIISSYRNCSVSKEFATLDELFNYDLSKINTVLEGLN